MKEDLTNLFEYITVLTKSGCFGKLVLSFEHGRIVNIKREENIKLAGIKRKLNEQERTSCHN